MEGFISHIIWNIGGIASFRPEKSSKYSRSCYRSHIPIWWGWVPSPTIRIANDINKSQSIEMKNLAEPVKKQDFTLVRWLLGQVSERVRLFPGCGSEISDVTISIHFPLLSGLTDHVVLSTSERLYWARRQSQIEKQERKEEEQITSTS